MKNNYVSPGNCPATGLPVRTRPDWNGISLGAGCYVSFSLIGDNILLVMPRGPFEKSTLERMFLERLPIVDHVTPPFFELIDFEHFSIRPSGNDWKYFAGYYSDYCKGKFDLPRKPGNTLTGLLGFNAPLPLKLAVNSGRTGLRKESPLYIMSSYESAVKEAAEALPPPLDRPGIVPGNDGLPVNQPHDFKHYTVQLLDALNSIGEDDDFLQSLDILPGHPFFQVFEAIARVKKDLEEFLNNHQAVEKRLAQRSIELENAKEEIQKQAERLMQANKELEKLSIVASETSNVVIIMDAQGNVEWVNEGFHQVYNMTLEDLIEERGPNLLTGSANEEIERYYKQCITRKESVSYDTFTRLKNGEEFWSHSTLTPILDDQGNIVKLVTIDSDITRIKESEEKIIKQSIELRKASEAARREREVAEAANRSKNEFLALVSHEIRTPMNGVIGFADILMDTGLNDEQKEYVQTIKRSGEALLVIINDILDFTKIEAGELALQAVDFSIEEAASDVCEIIRPRLSGKPVEIMWRLADNVPDYVKSDPGRFRQVLLNLVGNAAKFTKKGEIELAFSVAAQVENRTKLHITIRDTGIGIPKEKLETIFEPFVQVDSSASRTHGGTGLGLAICKRIATLMNGDIWGESEPGNGTTFYLTGWVEISAKKSPWKSIVKHLEGKRVLLADSIKSCREILGNMLNRAKLRVSLLTRISAVPKTLVVNAENGDPFDICLIEVGNDDGQLKKLTASIRDLDPPLANVPLLALTSAASLKPGRYRDAGFDQVLRKPVPGKKLIPAMCRLMGIPFEMEDIDEDIVDIDEDIDGDIDNKDSTSNNIDQTFKKELDIDFNKTGEEKKASQGIHILLAEDNPINRKLTQYLIAKAGHKLSTVENGLEAVSVFTANPGEFDLILMDIQMPHMNGRDATRAIREKGFTRVPIIAMTAEAIKGDREKCIDAGMNDYISKPVKPANLYQIISKWAESGSSSGSRPAAAGK